LRLKEFELLAALAGRCPGELVGREELAKEVREDAGGVGSSRTMDVRVRRISRRWRRRGAGTSTCTRYGAWGTASRRVLEKLSNLPIRG
jgi:Transcriptional regulatory protein, C terminal